MLRSRVHSEGNELSSSVSTLTLSFLLDCSSHPVDTHIYLTLYECSVKIVYCGKEHNISPELSVCERSRKAAIISKSIMKVRVANWPCEECVYGCCQVCVKLSGHSVSHCGEAVFNRVLWGGWIEHKRPVPLEACRGKGCRHTEHSRE